MCSIIRLVLSSILLLGVVVSVEAQGQNIERPAPPFMSAREAHAKALAGELVLVDIRTADEWRKTDVPASGYAITMHQDQATFMWSPCAGPTLGAAIGLAAQRETMLQAAAVMAIFGFGAATPVLALAYGSRQVMLTRRDRLRRLSAFAKPIMGIAIAAVSLFVLTGLDKMAETHVTNAMPDWLLNVITRY